MFGPDFWAADFTWDSFGYMAGLHHLLAPLRQKIQALARKHRDKSHTFTASYDRLVDTYIAKYRDNPGFQRVLAQFLKYKQRVEPRFKEPAPQSAPFALSELSARQLRALRKSLRLSRGLLVGAAPRVQPKTLVEIFSALAAQRPGPQPSAGTVKIRALDKKARTNGERLTDGAIAKMVFPKYGRSTGDERRQMREIVRVTRRVK